MRRSEWRYNRGEGLEFDRVIFFTDALFAIAMTILIVSLELPAAEGPDPNAPHALLGSIGDVGPQIFSFFLAFLLIARYWMAHHEFFASVKSVDRGLIAINLVYLSFIAFLPFPTRLVGQYEANPISVVLFAMCLGIISTLEAVMFRHAVKHDFMRRPMSAELYRYGMTQSLIPVGLFVVSIPIAFLSPTLALLSWLLTIPIGIWVDRRAPSDAKELLRPLDEDP